MIVQREIEAVMLAIDNLVWACINNDGKARNKARIDICDTLKEVMRSAETGK